MSTKLIHRKLRGKKIVEVSTFIEPEFSEVTVTITVEDKNGEEDCWYFTAGSKPVARSAYLKGDNLKRSNERYYALEGETQ
jgi:hypothetical protein